MLMKPRQRSNSIDKLVVIDTVNVIMDNDKE